MCHDLKQTDCDLSTTGTPYHNHISQATWRPAQGQGQHYFFDQPMLVHASSHEHAHSMEWLSVPAGRTLHNGISNCCV
jgi:hypothetical protein